MNHLADVPLWAAIVISLLVTISGVVGPVVLRW